MNLKTFRNKIHFDIEISKEENKSIFKTITKAVFVLFIVKPFLKFCINHLGAQIYEYTDFLLWDSDIFTQHAESYCKDLGHDDLDILDFYCSISEEIYF